MINIIGVYKVENNPDVHLIELTSDKALNFDEITQEVEGVPRLDWQAPYDDQFLNETGSEVVNKPNAFPHRVVFFMHFLDFTKPIKIEDQDIVLPEPSEFPERLKDIISYESLD
jgi:hypothetical protein